MTSPWLAEHAAQFSPIPYRDARSGAEPVLECIYLLPEPHARIRENLKTSRITPTTAPITQVLAGNADKSFDAYSIADVSSYLSEDDFGALMHEIMRTARPNARLCSRGIFVHRPLPPEYLARVQREPELEERLSIDDMAMVHGFPAGTISPYPKPQQPSVFAQKATK